ncbi:ABC transporter substrate-binding protein, partial [Alcaligenaceae bacterium]|nr:ABC transporter substrate-binding protein [Alcaligenaceae bacterium]
GGITPVALKTHPKYRRSPITTNRVTSSPRNHTSKVADEKSGLERFDKFFRPGRPYLDSMVFVIIADRNAQALAISRGDVQLSGFSPISLQEIKRLQENPKLTVTQSGYQGIGPLYWLEFNMRKAPFSDVRVRQAIAYAIDKEFIRTKLHRGISRQAIGPIAAESPFFEPDQNPYDLDLAKANKLLDEAGLKPNAQGIRFTTRMDWTPANRDHYQLVAEYMKPQLQKIGIDVQLRPSPDFSTWAQRISNWDFDMGITAAYNYGDPTIGVARTYMSTNIRKGVIYSNTEGYVNPKVDELLQAAAAESDQMQRKALYSEFQKIINKDVPVTFLFEVPITTIYDKKLQNVPLGIWGVLSPMDAVYWDKTAN